MWQFRNENSITIPNGADMKSDTYKIPGVYVCHSDTNTNTLLNCPCKNAFTLFVYKSIGMAASYIIQEYRIYDGRAIYRRYFNGYNNSWGEIFEYTGSPEKG